VAVLRAVPDSRTLVFCAGKGTAQWVRAQLQRLLEVGPGRYCSPRHPTYFEASSLELGVNL
jgi:hypothetical protein